MDDDPKATDNGFKKSRQHSEMAKPNSSAHINEVAIIRLANCVSLAPNLRDTYVPEPCPKKNPTA